MLRSGLVAGCTAALAGLGLAGAGCSKESPLAPPALVATCSATPASGTAPLAVSFNLNVAGAQGSLSLQIRYGDGQSGTDATASHTYASPGTYTATLTVTTPSQSALCSATVQVSGPAAGPSPSPSPTTGPNQPPLAVFRTEPDPAPGGRFVGRAPFRIHFNMCATQDPEGDRFLFTMDFEGDKVLDVEGSTGGDCRRTHEYGGGTFHPRLCVTDLNVNRQPAHPFQCRSYTVDLLRR